MPQYARGKSHLKGSKIRKMLLEEIRFNKEKVNQEELMKLTSATLAKIKLVPEIYGCRIEVG